MSKFVALVLIFLLSPILAAVYGILHDQITYSISPEYYTSFKFIQFGFISSFTRQPVDYPRVLVAAVGVMATWWVGIPIGVLLGLTGLIHRTGEAMFRVTRAALVITLVVAMVVGLVGLLYGKFYLASSESIWWVPDDVINKGRFIMVGAMHNFSYIGGAIGTILGIFYSIRKRKKVEKYG